MWLAIDFDGTIAKHEWPYIGAPVPGAFEYMKKFQKAGIKLMLWTMRGTKPEDTLTPAVDYCKKHGVVFDAVGRNPTQDEWTDSNKAFCHRYVDDAAIGCPLIYPPNGKPYVDWEIVGPMVLDLYKGKDGHFW